MLSNPQGMRWPYAAALMVALSSWHCGDSAAPTTQGVSQAPAGASAAGASAPVAGHAVAGSSAAAGVAATAAGSSAAAAGRAAPLSTGAGGAGAAASSGVSAAGAAAVGGTTGDVGAGAAGVSGASGAGATSGEAGAPGTAGTGAAGAAAGGEAPAREDYGKGDGSDVVTIGDSWMNILTNGGGIEGGLDRAGTKYRHYAVAGTQLINGQIPGQYDQAKAINPNIKTVILTGGGNDVMFTGGCNTKEACEMSVMRITEALNDLYTKMAADGVTSTVYIQYSANVGTAPKDTRPMTSMSPAICLSGKIRCLGIPTTDLIAATDSIDGIHPTQAGCDRIAKAVMESMEKNGARR